MQLQLPGNLGCLRVPRDEDAPSIARHANNRKVAMNLRDLFPHPYSIDDARRFIKIARERKPPNVMVIEVHADGVCEAAGGIGVHVQEDVERVSAELGYWLAEPFWGRGITTAAVRAMVTYAFATFPVTRVFALPYASNAASARVLEKVGFRLEARMLRAVIKDGVVQDQLMYAVTDEEWPTLIRQGCPPPLA